MREIIKKFSILFLATAFVLIAVPAYAEHSIEKLFSDGNFFGEVRYRYEHVDQDGRSKNAKASLVRTNLGFETGTLMNLQALGEIQIVESIGADSYNNTVNGKGNFPVVMDPENREINRLWLLWSGIPDTKIKVGRQNINLNNERFISSVDWRQNDQNFDGVTIKNNSIENLKLTYGYVGNVNRFLGEDSPLGDLDSHIHIANAAYKHAEWLKIAAYGFWADFEDLPPMSHKMYGLRLRGDIPVSDRLSLIYEAEAAQQSDHADNPASYKENYHRIVPGIQGYGTTLQVGHESLGGNGTNSVIVPLSHWQKFNGRVEQFINTPAVGLKDSFVKAKHKVISKNELLNGIKLEADFHKFKGDKSGDFGSEIDLSIGKKFKTPDFATDSIDLLLQYGHYNGKDAPFTDSEKIWFQVKINF